MASNWDEMASNFGGFASYAAPGTYEVNCAGVVFEETGKNGSIAAKFEFDEQNGTKFPVATHWLSFKNDAWRKWHFKCLLVVLGSSEEKAREAIDKVEALEGKDRKINGYQQIFDRLLNKGEHKVSIDVYPDGKYTRSEFSDRSVAMDNSASDKKDAAIDAEMDKVVTGTNVDDEIDLSDLPF